MNLTIIIKVPILKIIENKLLLLLQVKRRI